MSALMVLAVALRWRTLGTNYWGDEAIAIGISRHSIGAMPHYLADDGSPPLYYVALHYWLAAFGSSERATHVLSLVPAVLAVPAAWWAGVRLWGRRAGIFGAALVATCSYLDYYATETRMYSWLVFVAVLAVATFALAWRDGGLGRWAAAVALMGTALYLQYYALYLLVAVVAVGLASAWRHGDRGRVISTALFGAASAAIFAPWVPQLISQAHHTGAPWAPHPSPLDLFADSFNSVASAGWAGLIVAIGIALAGWARNGGGGQPAAPGERASTGSGARGSTLAMVTAIPLIGALFAWCAAQAVNSWDPRYLGIFTVPALMALGGGLARARWGRVGALIAIGALTATAVPVLVDKGFTVRTEKSDAAYLVSSMRPLLHRGDLVISSEVTDMPVFAYYLGRGYHYATPLGPLPSPLVVNWSNLTARLRSAKAARNLAPLVAAVPVGGHVLVVGPSQWGGGETPKAYLSAVEDQAKAADAFIAHSRELRRARSLGVPPYSDPLYPMQAVLYVKVASGSAS